MTRFTPALAVEINGVPVGDDVAAAVTDLSVTSELDAIDHCSVTLANPQPAMRWTHEPRDTGLFREGNTLLVKLGYDDSLTTLFDGEITALSPAFPETGTPTLRVDGYSRLHRLRGSPHTRTFVNTSDADIARQIARDAGLRCEADVTPVRHTYVLQYNETDLAFLLGRARRIRFAVQVTGRTLHFKGNLEAAQPVLQLRYGEADEAADVASLRSFSPTLNALRPVGRVVVRGHDPVTRDPIEARASTDATALLGGATSGPNAAARAFGAREEIVVDVPVASPLEATKYARAIHARRALEFVTGTAASVGLPELTAGRVVELLGVGRFSGRYHVTRATHTFGPGGYLTTFSVRSDSTA